jgi:hypothetical protein
MSRLTRQARTGERSGDAAGQPGRGVSDVRLRHWLLNGTAPVAISGNGAGQRTLAQPAALGRPGHEATPAQRKLPGRERHRGPAPGLGSFGGAGDRAGTWLRCAGVAVGLVAAAAAAVSYEAQWRLVYADKHELDVSYIQAAIPDLGALVFACFGIALALHGRRAIRARLLNLLCVGISITMNALAARPGWTGLAVWVMSPVIYALASDTLNGVIRAYVIGRQKQLREVLADDGITVLQIVGAVLLWLLRLALAPPSTLKGFHAWVKSLPAAPLMGQAAEDGRPKVTAARPEPVKGPQRGRPEIANSRGPRGGTKQEQFLTLVIARYGPLTGFDIKAVSRAAAELAPEAELHPGTARKILRAQVLAARNGDCQ